MPLRGYLWPETGIGIHRGGQKLPKSMLTKKMTAKNTSAKGKFMRYWLSLLLLLVAAAALAASAPGYKVVKTYKVGGDGGWDYLTADSDARRLYISRATHLIVLDLDSGKTVG